MVLQHLEGIVNFNHRLSRRACWPCCLPAIAMEKTKGRKRARARRRRRAATWTRGRGRRRALD
eukprot:6184103-Pleurochrysis_carterae.AAC.1